MIVIAVTLVGAGFYTERSDGTVIDARPPRYALAAARSVNLA
jgi:hypothetical protein